MPFIWPKITSQSNWTDSLVFWVQNMVFRSDDPTLNQRKKFDRQLCNSHGGFLSKVLTGVGSASKMQLAHGIEREP